MKTPLSVITMIKDFSPPAFRDIALSLSSHKVVHPMWHLIEPEVSYILQDDVNLVVFFIS